MGDVIAAITASRERTLDRLIGGLGSACIGQVAGRQLAEVAETLPSLLSWSAAEAREKVGSIHGFGAKMVAAVVSFLQDPVQRRVLEKLRDRGVGRPQPTHLTATEGPLVGMTFCVTARDRRPGFCPRARTSDGKLILTNKTEEELTSKLLGGFVAGLVLLGIGVILGMVGRVGAVVDSM